MGKIISWVKRQDEHRVFWYEFSVYKGVGYGKMKIIQSDFYMSHIHKQRVEYHQIKLSYEDLKKNDSIILIVFRPSFSLSELFIYFIY